MGVTRLQALATESAELLIARSRINQGQHPIDETESTTDRENMRTAIIDALGSYHGKTEAEQIMNNQSDYLDSIDTEIAYWTNLTIE